ncbi:inner-membrane translocator [Streptomyces sp. A0958]|uniref:inner-membrane translocator n=1 Tax=Streptomyces sp. A0958 TaxID=2563101 RepID=UPI00109E9BF0|nr:inner-membrane translocator [Streptomyces sp. A0958]THA59536.1 inner-membrane translocator [Streptomyces sp. A0958]
MPELDDKQPPGREGALTAGCLLLLVLVADVAAALLVVIVLAVRGLDRMDTGSGRTTTGAPALDWAPVLGFGALALALGVTAVVLLRIGHRVIGAVQLTLCVFPALHMLGYWL